MRRLAYVLLVTAALSRTLPVQAQGTAERLVSFDPGQVNLRWVNRSWQLSVGADPLKDFGPHQAEAWEAVRIIRGLRLTQHGTVGTPQPIMEYWLANGQAPQGLAGGLRLFPIDQASLKAADVHGQWCVLDAHRILFNFGPQKADAQQALDILRRYAFTQIGYVGWPNPLMVYFLGGGSALAGPGILSPRPLAVPASGTAAPSAPTIQGRILLAGVHQLTAPMGGPSEGLRFDPGRVQVEQEKGVWRLLYGKNVLASFGNAHDARQALDVLQYYRFTEQRQIGAPEPTFTYFLVRGQPPRGLRFGVPVQSFRPESVAIKQVGPRRDWMVCDGDQPLLNCGGRREDAQQVVDVIHRWHCDHLCRIGPLGPLSMTFLVQGR